MRRNVMKVELTLVLKTTEKAYGALEEIKKAGFNATVMSSESLHLGEESIRGVVFIFAHLESVC